MNFLVKILTVIYKWKLKRQGYRKEVYQKAINHDLRASKFGRLKLRNLNELMSENPEYHEEFREIAKPYGDFQKVFWESDLGFLWYQGNFKTNNIYFQHAIEQARENHYKSILDVGCGWGQFNAEVSELEDVEKSVGIDVSESLIKQAKKLNGVFKAEYFHKNIEEISEYYDLITFFGSTDYIHPDKIADTIKHCLDLANKEVIMVNSLRKLPFEEMKKLSESRKIKRYDEGYIHPLQVIMEKMEVESNLAFSWKLEKFGPDSAMLTILKEK